MNSLGDVIGDICKVVLPIKEEYFLGDPNSSTAVCTLGSIGLLKELKDSEIIDRVAIIGRLLSENKGIDSMVRYVNQKDIKKIILCGKDVWGHKAGHSLIKLHENGIDYGTKRIVGSASPEPFLTVSQTEIEHFQAIELVDMIGETNLERISANV